MWSVDGLQNHLIHEVAFTGEKGISFPDVGPIITNFYSSQTSAKEEENYSTLIGLLPNLPNRRLSKYFRNNASLTSSNPDGSFCEKVWGWLQSHPDTLTRADQSSETLNLNNATQDVDEQACLPELSPSRCHRKHGPKIDKVDGKSLIKQDHLIYGTESRIWQAVAGHGIDYQKIHALEFKLLSIIGNRQQQGIVQPDLIRISGQDKRSVPKRTDKLQDHGYIIKRPVIWNGMRTSHCTLKEFAKLPNANATASSGVDSVDCLDINKFLRKLFAILQKAKIIPLSELRLAMGSSGHRRETKFLALAIRRLEILGCLTRVLANVLDKPTKVTRWMQCVKYIKVPTDDEREGLTTMTHDQEALIRANRQQDDQDFTCITEAHWSANSANDMNDEMSLPGQSTLKANPCWTPYLSYYDLIYISVEKSGAKGISSMKLRDNIFGRFCKKPFDVIISRLTDDDRTSQPISLRHLTLIKDTSFLDRVSHYTYRTYFNFKLAIESGEAAEEVLQTPKMNPPPETTTVPWAADGCQLWFLNTYNDALLSLHRITSVSISIKLSEPIVNNRRGKRGSHLMSNNQKSPYSSKGFSPAMKSTSMKETPPRKRGRPRKHPSEKEGSQRRPQALSNDHSQSADNELVRLSTVELCEKVTNETLLPINLNSRETESDKTQLSSVPCVQQKNTKPTRKRKRSFKDSYSTPLKSVKIHHHPQRFERHNTGKSPNESLIPTLEQEAFHQTKKFADLHNNSMSGHSSNYEVGNINREMTNKHFRRGDYRKSKEQIATDRSLVAVIRSNGLRRFDWFDDNNNQSNQSQADHQGDTDYAPTNEGNARSLISRQPVRKSSRLVPTNTLHTDFRINLSGKAMQDQFCSMILDSETVQLNQNQINNTSSKPSLDFRGVTTADAGMGYTSTATTIVHNLLPSQKLSSWPRSSAVNGILPTSAFKDHRIGSAEPSIRTQENEKLVRNADLNSKDGNSAEDQDTSPPKPLDMSIQQQNKPRRQFVASGLNKKLNDRHVKDTSIRSNDKELFKKQKPSASGGSIAHQRTQIVYNLVQKCEGVFPGGSEICPPFSNLWKKLYGTTTDSRTIMRAVKDTIDCGKLRRVHFSFRSKDGTIVTKNLLTLVNITPDAPSVRMLQRAMIDSFPKLYRPPQVEDNILPKPLTLIRHVFHKDLSSPAERQFRPLYLQRLEEHRASMANKRLTRSLENHRSIRNKIRQKRDQFKYLSNSRRLPGPLTGSGITRLSCLPRLSLLASSNQTSLGRKAVDSFTANVDRDSKKGLKCIDQLGDKFSARDIHYLYQNLQPTMTIDPSWGRLMNLIVDFGLQDHLDRKTSLTRPIQSFQPFTGTFATEFSIIRVKANFSHEILTESIQPVLEEIMPQSVAEMRFSQRNNQSQQDSSQLNQEHSRFSQEIKEVCMWEKNNETLVSSDLKLQRARFINHTVPKLNSHGYNRLPMRPTGIGSISWLPLDTRHNSDQNKYPELQSKQQKGDDGNGCRLAKTKKSRLSSDYFIPDQCLGASILINAYHDTAYWPRVAHSPYPVSSVLGDFHLLSSSIQKHYLPPTPSQTQSLISCWDKRHLSNQSPSPEHNQVRLQGNNHATYASSVLATKPFKENSAQIANEDNCAKKIQTNKLIKRQRHRIRRKAILTEITLSRRLLLAVNVIRILSGGIERLVDWNLVVRSSREFSQMTPSSLKRHWLFLRRKFCSDTISDEARIQEALLIAFKGGCMPSIDFQDLQKCEWKVIVDLVHQILQGQEMLSKKNVHNAMAEVQFSYPGTDQIQDLQSIRNELNSQSTLQMRRDHLLTVLPSWEILDSTESDGVAPTAFQKGLQTCKARSWVRANILTPSENYCPEAALQKLQQLGEERVTNALKFFEERNFVREANNRAKNLRNLEMSESFYAGFKTPINTSVLNDAVAYKFNLDEWIMSKTSHGEVVEPGPGNKSNRSVSIDPASPSGAFLAITNLVANDRIAVHLQSLPLAIGCDDPSPTTMEYNLEIFPSSRYIQGNPLQKSGHKWPPVAPMLTEGNAAGKIPLWVDIHGNHLQPWWDRVRACVLGLIATRSGISINGLKYAMNELVEHWEISAVVRWLINAEAVKWLDGALHEESMLDEQQLEKGLSTREWWWMALA